VRIAATRWGAGKFQAEEAQRVAALSAAPAEVEVRRVPAARVELPAWEAAEAEEEAVEEAEEGGADERG
jgi:hypothetical protein